MMAEKKQLQIENEKLKIENKAVNWPKMPTETEIYILPDGTVVVTDLPVELQLILTELGEITPCEIPPTKP